MDEAPKISMLQVSSSEASTEAIPEAIPASFVASCSEAEESQAKETCSKQTKTLDDAAFFDDCVFDVCHGAGESAAEITAELLASNQAILSHG